MSRYNRIYEEVLGYNDVFLNTVTLFEPSSENLQLYNVRYYEIQMFSIASLIVENLYKGHPLKLPFLDTFRAVLPQDGGLVSQVVLRSSLFPSIASSVEDSL